MKQADCGSESAMNEYLGKRALDVAISGTAFMMFAPLATAIGVAVWLEDGGAPLFEQSRVGRERRSFTILKFRTMRDQRITRMGRWLRRTGLDELPQFINVCRGEMSVVGPRPLTEQDVQRLGWASQRHDWRFDMRPGITGLPQLLAGAGARHSERLDRLYLTRQSPLLDLQLIGLSFAANIFGKRAVRNWLSTSSACGRGRAQRG